MTDATDARFWDRTAPRYARDTIKDMPGYERSLARIAALIDGRSVLELGCGTGQSAMRLAPRAASYLGTDISEGMIAIARQRLAAQPVPHLQFRQGTAETLAGDMAGEDRQFEVILGLNYLHLVRDLPATLAATHRMLPPGGLFVSKTACLGDMTVLLRPLLAVMRALGKAPHVTVFGAQQLEDALRAAGFHVEAVERHASKGRDARPFIIARKP